MWLRYLVTVMSHEVRTTGHIEDRFCCSNFRHETGMVCKFVDIIFPECN